MNKNQFTHLSSQNIAFREYLQFAKASSKDKFEPMRKKSKSPVHTETQRKFNGSSEAEQYKIIEQRYKQLENKYRDLLEKAKHRNFEHQQLKRQLKTYQKYHQRNAEQIQRLRCIIGLIKKPSVSVQVQEDQFDSQGRASRLNKFDQSTEVQIKLRNSGQKFNSKDKMSPFKNSFIKTETGFTEKMINKDRSLGLYSKNKSKYTNLTNFDNNISCSNLQYRENKQSNKVINKKLTNSPYSKLRFVPNASFK